MIDIANLKIGDKVYYQPDYYDDDKWKNGIVKEVVDFDNVRVVYHCDGNWNNYMDYTSALTLVRDLKLGWRHRNKSND